MHFIFQHKKQSSQSSYQRAPMCRNAFQSTLRPPLHADQRTIESYSPNYVKRISRNLSFEPLTHIHRLLDVYCKLQTDDG